MQIIKPRRLEHGQTIGVVAPSSPPREPAEIDVWLDRIRDLGFQVRAGKHIYDRYGYLAGLDQDRAADVNSMFADDEVDAIFCLRSGYGSARTLQYLDFGLIQSHPKIIIGFSDLTALVNAIHVKTGLVTFHGPEAEDQIVLRPYSRAEFSKVLLFGQSNIRLGGNLNTIVRLLGTPYEPDFRGALLFLETYGQDTYALGDLMHHLWLAGKLQQVAGVIFGQFHECEDAGFTKHEVLAEHLVALKIPALCGLMIGHMDQQTTLPIGCEAELDVDAGTLTLLEPAVTW